MSKSRLRAHQTHSRISIAGVGVPDHYREQMIWLSVFCLLDVIKSAEQHYDADLKMAQRAHWGRDQIAAAGGGVSYGGDGDGGDGDGGGDNGARTRPSVILRSAHADAAARNDAVGHFLKSSLAVFPRGCHAVLPVLFDIGEGYCDTLAPFAGYNNLYTCGREIIARLVTYVLALFLMVLSV